MAAEHEHKAPEMVCGGLVQSAEDEIAAATLYEQTATLLENCAMGEAGPETCPSMATDRELLELAEEVRKIDEEERTHGLQFVEMLDNLHCADAAKRNDLQRRMQDL